MLQTAAMILELDNYMKSLVETTNELVTTKEKAAVLNELAVKDALTGVRNRTAYNAEAKKIDWKIQDGFTEFGIVMIDLNFLKRTNDMYGHDKGNIAIKNLCKLICTTYQHSPVFRIGGDEFVVIVENEDYRNVNELTKTFKSTLAELAKDVSLEPWESISAAAGVALFDPQYDNNTENVCKRADKAMYENKKAMKAVRME